MVVNPNRHVIDVLLLPEISARVPLDSNSIDRTLPSAGNPLYMAAHRRGSFDGLPIAGSSFCVADVMLL